MTTKKPFLLNLRIIYQERKNVIVDILLALTVIFTILSEVTTWGIEGKEGKITEAMLYSNELNTTVTNDLIQNFKFTYLAFNHASLLNASTEGISDPVLKDLDTQFNVDGNKDKYLDGVADRLLIIAQSGSKQVSETNNTIQTLKEDFWLSFFKFLRALFSIFAILTTSFALFILNKERQQNKAPQGQI